MEGDELETLLAQIYSGAVSFCTDRQQMLHLCRKISPEYDCTVTLLPASGSSDKLVAACRCVTVQATYAHQEGEYAHLRLVLRTVPMNMHQLLYQEYIRLIRYVLLKNVAKYLRCTKEWGLIYQKTILDPSMPIAEHPSLVLSDNLPAFPMLSSPIEFPCYIDAVHGNDYVAVTLQLGMLLVAALQQGTVLFSAVLPCLTAPKRSSSPPLALQRRSSLQLLELTLFNTIAPGFI